MTSKTVLAIGDKGKNDFENFCDHEYILKEKMMPEITFIRGGLVRSGTRGQLKSRKGDGRMKNLKFILIIAVFGGIAVFVDSAVADYENLVKSFNPIAYI